MVAIDAVLGHRQVLGVSTERALDVPEHPVADGEPSDRTSDLLDLAGELVPEDRRLGLSEAAEQPDDDRLAGAVAAVGAVHRRCMDLDQHVVVTDLR